MSIMGEKPDKSLGKNVSFSEDQRRLLVTLIKVIYKNIVLPTEEAHDLLKAIRMAVDFSPAEQEILKKRAARVAAQQAEGQGPLKKIGGGKS